MGAMCNKRMVFTIHFTSLYYKMGSCPVLPLGRGGNCIETNAVRPLFGGTVYNTLVRIMDAMMQGGINQLCIAWNCQAQHDDIPV